MAKKDENDLDARLTVRVEPEYRAAFASAALQMGLNQSILMRNAIQEYMERNAGKFSRELAAYFKRFRENRERPGML
jgi:hypothetical protein